jgi:D-glycerate 3-kinase
MTAECIAPARQWLELNTRLDARQMDNMAALAPMLLERISALQARVTGLSGPPGSGKSTLAGMLAAVANGNGQPAVVLSLDNYYLSRQERQQLAERVHPLLAQRGVPGSHDLPRLVDDLARLGQERDQPLELLRFDKARDERSAQPQLVAPGPPMTILLEGWLVGLPPQAAAQLATPCNELELRNDPNGHWRSWVNAALASYQQRLWPCIGQRWALLAPGWEQVVEWRWQQEQHISPGQRHLASRADVRTFLARFERLVGHHAASAAAWADLILYLDEHHHFSLEPPA